MKYAPLIVLLVGLSACTVRQPQVLDWEQQREQVAALDSWEFRGRMAVKVADDPDASGQIAVDWRQSADVSKVRLSGPLGVGAWQMVWEPERVSLADAAGERAIEYTGPAAAEEFMQAELGWAFPADSIRYWVRGLPAPSGTDLERRAEDGRLVGFRQFGWDIEFDRYGEFSGLALPTRITMEGRGVRLRVVVSRWKAKAGN